MRLPVIRGLIDRRILVNYRVDPAVLAKVLPAPFRPSLVQGYGIAGICLIRLKHVRPRFIPRWMGLKSENAAHRIAVTWDEVGQTKHGVYIPRRDSSSRLNTLFGGRLFPGIQHHARFDVRESARDYRVAVRSDDRLVNVLVEGSATDRLPVDSVFQTVDEVSAFFEQGSLGYSATRREGRFDGMELRSFTWSVTPLDVRKVESSYFADVSLFPPGSATFDNALLMRGIEHEWHSRAEPNCDCVAPVATG